jgi:hypothetical protein
MNAKLDPTLLPALAAIESVMDQPATRPSLDRRQLLNSMQRLDYEMRLRHYPALFEDEGPDAREHFESQMCPADSNFR